MTHTHHQMAEEVVVLSWLTNPKRQWIVQTLSHLKFAFVAQEIGLPNKYKHYVKS